MRGVTLEAKARNVGRCLGPDAEVIVDRTPVGFCITIIDNETGQTYQQQCHTEKQFETLLQKMHSLAYRTRAQLVSLAQGGLCKFCGEQRPLECDHIMTRGRHGRLDSVSNIRMLCRPCHQRRHSGK